VALLSIIVPVHNEAPQLQAVVERLMASTYPIEREWLFVDDGSTDRSLSMLKELQGRYGYRILEQKPGQGKGAAVRRGIQDAKGDVVIVQDADFEYDPQDIPAVIQPILEGRADVVYGSRFKNASPEMRRTFHTRVNRFLTQLSNLMTGTQLTDMETCYKAFRANLLKAMNLTSCRFGIEVELTAYVAKTRARIQEVSISYAPRTRLEGKKINWKDGFAALGHLIRFNWLTSTRSAFHHLPASYAVSPSVPNRA